MLLLKVITGRQAGLETVARRFPFAIGRAQNASLRLDDDGVWDEHLHLEVRLDEGAVMFASREAFTSVNGYPVTEAVLRNGDLLEVGSVRIQFGLSPTRQYSLKFREAFTWFLLGLLGLAQVGLIYWLISCKR